MSETMETRRAAPEKRSIAPAFWLPFGAGGMVAALFGPALILITGFLAPSVFPARFASYESALAFARHPLGKLIILAVIALFLWHGAERVFLTLKDMKTAPVPNLKVVTYGLAAAVSLLTAIMLLLVGF